MHGEQCQGMDQFPAQQEPFLLREGVWKAVALPAYALFLAVLCLFRPEWLPAGTTLLFISLVSLWDWRWYRVPNLFTYPTMAVGVFYHTLTAGWGGMVHSLEGLLLGGALLLLAYLFKAVGAGDVKALAALGAWWGAGPVFEMFLAAALLGGIVSLVILTIQGKLSETARRYWFMMKIFLLTAKFYYVEPSSETGRHQLPYGVVISCGVILWYMARNFSWPV
jgi:prepilin peptidase CpaA